MKRIVSMFVTSLLLCGMTFAQDMHWSGSYASNYEFPMLVVGRVYLDGELQNRENIEVAAFVGNELRGTKRLIQPYPSSTLGYFAWTSCWLTSAGETFTFKAYDHGSGIEYDLCDATVIGQRNAVGDVENPVLMHFTRTQGYIKSVTGYGEENDGGYVLIASPIDEIAPSDVENMTTGTYDLYAFNQGPSDGDEWRNFKASEFTSLESGKGYLYANHDDVDLVFTGTPYEGDGVFGLDFVAGADFEGMNLVGNPFTVEAYSSLPYYILNALGEFEETQASVAIPAMEGVFVVATSEDENVTFSTEPGKKLSSLTLNLVSSNTLVDRATVNFEEARQLPKFQLNSNNTKLYFPMSDKDYAIISSEEMGELPVNFKAEKSGSYTLAISSENVSFGYLHLIDNMTGADINLLSTPNYSFEAKTNDYASRFKLVFATNASTDSETFAFFNNGSFVINNEGEATMQVEDVAGRILSTETIHGCANVNINAAPGIYMIRLINGDNVKVQKVVVR